MSVDSKKQNCVHESEKHFHRANIDNLTEKASQLEARKDEINSNLSDFQHFKDLYGDEWRMLETVNNWSRMNGNYNTVNDWHVNRVLELVQVEEDKIWEELEVITEELWELGEEIKDSMSEIEEIEKYCSKHCLKPNGIKE